jgi:hypothetical protein
VVSWNSNCGMMDADELRRLLRSLEGSLLGIYVFDAGRQAWKNSVDALSQHAEGLELAVDDRLVDAAHFDEIHFEDSSTRVLRAHVRGIEWTSTLFREDQVEFQAAPEDFVEREGMVLLVDVLQAIADATGRMAVLVPETAHPADATPLASARPSQQGPVSSSTDGAGRTSGS